jgi:hypothetical protein
VFVEDELQIMLFIAWSVATRNVDELPCPNHGQGKQLKLFTEFHVIVGVSV